MEFVESDGELDMRGEQNFNDVCKLLAWTTR